MRFEDKHLEKITYVFGIAGVVTLVVTTILFLANRSFDTKQTLDTVVFNDYGSFLAGSAGLLFTIATTILVYLTYQTQKAELEEARKEAVASRKVIELQQFETTFFNLLSNHREVLKSLKETWFKDDHSIDDEDNSPKIFEGRMLIDVIVNFVKIVIRDIKVVKNWDGYSNDNELKYDGCLPKNFSLKREFEFDVKNVKGLSGFVKSKLANSEGLHLIYEKIYAPNRSSLGHYFRNLFHLIKFVDEYKGFDTLNSDPKEIADLKYKYIRLVRAQLSNNELILLALNSISSSGKEFIPFINNYKLLKNADIFTELSEMEGLLDKYPHFRQPN